MNALRYVVAVVVFALYSESALTPPSRVPAGTVAALAIAKALTANVKDCPCGDPHWRAYKRVQK